MTLRPVLVAAALAAGAAACTGVGAPLQSPAPGRPAPDFSLPTLDGGTVTLSSLRGKVVLVDFWASWCQPCTRELPALAALYPRYRDQGLAIVAVNQDQTAADARQFLAGKGISFTVALDPEGKVAERYNLPKMPTSFVVGRDGRIQYVNAGFEDGDDAKIEQAIESALR